MRRRGVEDDERVRVCALSAGCFDIPGEEGRRLVRGSSFVQSDPQDNAWAHPLEGLVAYLDLNSGEVVQVVETDIVPVPAKRFDYHLDSWLPEPRTSATADRDHPAGRSASFSLEDGVLEWEKWQPGVWTSTRWRAWCCAISFEDNGRRRGIVKRASVAEMVVPYGDPSPVRFWQNYFDAGEYSLGKSANSLELGCDCLGEIVYADAVLADDDGAPSRIVNAVCMHEEDSGILWKHTDEYTGSTDVRRQRRMVISFFITVGNYDYGFYWYLYLGGTIQLECKATGVVYTAAYAQHPNDYSTQYFHEGVGAPFRQHLFSARLVLDVDGPVNAVEEAQVKRLSAGPENPYGNAFTRMVRRLHTEKEGIRDALPTEGRVWRVVNPERLNAHGAPVAYELFAEGTPCLLADESSSIARRASLAKHHLWVTQYADAERFPSGQYVNQNPGNGALEDWVEQDRSIEGERVVLWHTFGLTHFPRSEDWPIMPVDLAGFTMKPSGFFDVNPTLDVPRPMHGGGCGEEHCGCGE
jgi:primary-amine oxidase